MFLTYSEYRAMGGTVSETDFPRYEYKARAYVNLYTHNRIRDESPVRECVKRLMVDLIGLTFDREREEAEASGIASKSNDGVSVTYGAADANAKAWNRRQRNALIEFLADEIDANGVPLLFGGVSHDTVRR